MKTPAAALVVATALTPIVLYAQARFSSGSVGVVLDVAVLDDGEIVRGLTAENFEVVDRGVRQRIEVRETANTPLDVVVVLQPLASLRPQGVALAERDIGEVFRLLLPDDRVAMLIASAPPALIRPLAGLAASPFQPSAGTWRGTDDVALWDSLFLSYRHFDRHERRKVVLMFTNSDHDAGVTGPRDIARMAELRPAQLFFLIVDKTGPDPWRISGGTNRPTTKTYFTLDWRVPPALFDLAKATGGEVIDLREGRANIARLLGYLRAEYLITFIPEGVSAGGWHDVRIRLKGRRGTVVARPGYWAPERQPGQ